MSELYDRIYGVVRLIPDGKVATYGQIASMLGNVRWSRAVGFALHVNPDPEHIHCFKVVNREGRLAPAFAFGGEGAQESLLVRSGVPVSEGRVDLETYQWRPEREEKKDR